MNNWLEVDYYPENSKQEALRKEFKFNDFQSALDFVNKVGEIAEKLKHHPDINFGWGYATIWTTSHDEHKITDRDHKLAAAIDQILE